MFDIKQKQYTQFPGEFDWTGCYCRICLVVNAITKMDALKRFHKFFFVYVRRLLKLTGHDILGEISNLDRTDTHCTRYWFCTYSVVCTHFLFTTHPLVLIHCCSCASVLKWVYLFALLDAHSAESVLFFPVCDQRNTYDQHQMLAKICMFSHSDGLKWMINYLHQNAKSKSKDRQRLACFETTSHYMELVFKFGSLLYNISATSYFVYPFYRFVFHHEIVPIITVYCPGCRRLHRFDMLPYYFYSSWLDG